MSSPTIGGPGITWGLQGLTGNGNQISLAAGETALVPAGQWYVEPGLYTFLQVRDPISGMFWTRGPGYGQTPRWVESDGNNVRLANLTGCAIGALITNVGSAYTSAPTVVASSGGSTWQAIIGGAINTTITITGGGAGYNYAPQIVIQAPPSGGLAATATCTISGGAVNAVTVTNQGAGYTSVPTVYVIPDAREASAASPGPTTAAVLTAALTGSGTMTGLICTNHGTALTSVPTLTITGGGGSSAAATVAMCFTTTGYTISTAGVAYGTSQNYFIQTSGGQVSGSAAITNPLYMAQLLIPRQALYQGVSNGSGVPQTGGTALDTGIFSAVPVGFTSPGSAVPTTQMVPTMTVGGVSDISFMTPVI